MAATQGRHATQDEDAQTPARRLAFWCRVRRLTLALLAVWGVVTLAACWFADVLNGVRLGSFPFGFWLSAQGAILVYVGLIAAYAWVMDRWEAALLDDPSASASASHG